MAYDMRWHVTYRHVAPLVALSAIQPKIHPGRGCFREEKDAPPYSQLVNGVFWLDPDTITKGLSASWLANTAPSTGCGCDDIDTEGVTLRYGPKP